MQENSWLCVEFCWRKTMKGSSIFNTDAASDVVMFLPCCLSACAAWENPAERIETAIGSRWFPPGNSDWGPVPDNLQQVSHEPEHIIISLSEVLCIFIEVDTFRITETGCKMLFFHPCLMCF